MRWEIGEGSHPAAAHALGHGRYRVALEGDRAVEVDARVEGDGTLVLTFPEGRVVRAAVSRAGEMRWVSAGGRTLGARFASGKKRAGADHGGGLEAPMPGKVTRVLVAVGDAVDKGQAVLTLEAMKMEHTLKAPRAGIVREVRAREGELVQPGAELVVLEPA